MFFYAENPSDSQQEIVSNYEDLVRKHVVCMNHFSVVLNYTLCQNALDVCVHSTTMCYFCVRNILCDTLPRFHPLDVHTSSPVGAHMSKPLSRKL